MKFTNLTTLILISSLTAACGGGGDGDSTTSGTNLSIPANAVVITEVNAEAIATSAVGTLQSTSAFFTAAETTTLPPVQNAINLISGIAFNKNKQASNIVSGISDSGICTDGGSWSDTWTETATSASGTATLNNCNEGGFILDGSFSYSDTWNNNTGAYTSTGNGTLTMTFGGESFTFKLNTTDNGNDWDGSFSLTLNFSISGASIGYLVETTSPLTGYYGTPTAGQIMVSGGSSTRLLITLLNSSQAKVELDNGNGSFVEIIASPITF
ncbi:MAG: hypothetical protein OEY43_08890 [Gammaproteobacteria bacterium]|nr:hypothetical protein [Gammaproteobacteria bacterium]